MIKKASRGDGEYTHNFGNLNAEFVGREKNKTATGLPFFEQSTNRYTTAAVKLKGLSTDNSAAYIAYHVSDTIVVVVVLCTFYTIEVLC